MYRCEPCAKDFDSKEAWEMHNLAKHMSSEEQEKHHKKKDQKKQILKILLYIGGILIVFLLVNYLWAGIQESSTYSNGQIHWHAGIEIYLCGERYELPDPVSSDLVHGEPYIGTAFMHEHNDNLIHIEGTIQKPEDITLGKFMDSIGLTFTSEQLITYTNGDLCPDGTPGKVKLLVNGNESNEFGNKVLADDNEYVLLFE